MRAHEMRENTKQATPSLLLATFILPAGISPRQWWGQVPATRDRMPLLTPRNVVLG